MRLTVIGCHGPIPPAGGACSGYLVEEGETRVLLDCGSGVLSQLQLRLDYNSVTAVVLSHLHSDHTSDLFVLRYGIEGDARLGLRRGLLPVYAVGEPEAEWRRLQHPGAFDVRRFGAQDHFKIGPLAFRFARAQHALVGVAISVESGDRRLVYSGDTAPCPEVRELARGADLFLCEASFAHPEDVPANVGHTSAVEAGQMAREAGAARLVVTHFHPRQDALACAQLAADAFGGPTEAAQAGKSFAI